MQISIRKTYAIRDHPMVPGVMCWALTLHPAGTASATALTVVVVAVTWAVFAFWAHGLLIGIQPV